MPRMNMTDMERRWGDRTVQAAVKMLERSPYAWDEVHRLFAALQKI